MKEFLKTNKWTKYLVAILMALIITLFFNSYNEIFSVAFGIKFIIFLFISIKCSNVELKHNLPIKLLSLFESLFLILGKQIAYFEKTNLLYLLLLPIIFLYFWLINSRIADGFNLKLKMPEWLDKITASTIGKLLVIFAGHLVMFIIFYPGIFFVDTAYSLLDEFAHTTHYSPIYSSILLILLNISYSKTAVSIITLINILIICFIYSKSIDIIQYKLSKDQISFITIITSLSFVLSLWSITIAKDSIFIPLLGLVSAYIYKYYDTGELKSSKFMFVLLIACLLRNNFLYVIIVAAIILLIINRNSKLLKNFFIVSILVLIYNFTLINVLHYASDGIKEMSSVPLQQIARTYTYYKEDFTDEEIQTLQDFTDGLIDYYIPTLSDPIKENVTTESFNHYKKNLISIYFKQLIKHPITYIDSPLENTYYLWYPESILQIYSNPNFLRYECKIKENFDYTEEEIKRMTTNKKNFFDTNSYFMYEEELLTNGIKEFITNSVWMISYENIPVISMLFSFGNFFWVLITTFFIAIYRKDKPAIFAFGFILLYLSSILFGPCILLRYIYILWIIFPVEIIYLFQQK